MPRSNRYRNRRRFVPRGPAQPSGQGSLALHTAFLREVTAAALQRCELLFGPAPEGGYTTEQHLAALRQLDAEHHPIVSAAPPEDWLTEEFRL